MHHGAPHCLSGSGSANRSGGTDRRPLLPPACAPPPAAAVVAAAAAAASADAEEKAVDTCRPRLLSWRGRARASRCTHCWCRSPGAAGCSLPRLRGVLAPSMRSRSRGVPGSMSEVVRPSGWGLVTSSSMRSFLPSCTQAQAGRQAGRQIRRITCWSTGKAPVKTRNRAMENCRLVWGHSSGTDHLVLADNKTHACSPIL